MSRVDPPARAENVGRVPRPPTLHEARDAWRRGELGDDVRK